MFLLTSVSFRDLFITLDVKIVTGTAEPAGEEGGFRPPNFSENGNLNVLREESL